MHFAEYFNLYNFTNIEIAGLCALRGKPAVKTYTYVTKTTRIN